MKTILLSTAAALALLTFDPSSLRAETVKWKGQSGEYSTGSNWIRGEVPNTATGDTAQIAAGEVKYTPGGDLTMAGGGKLQISGGSWTQVSGDAYIRLSGTGTIAIEGGTFNQGTASSVPFAIEGNDNVFSISSGTANISSSFNASPGLIYNQNGGTVNITGEFDFNTAAVSMSGGILNTTLLTGVNAPDQGKAVFNFSGGVINLSSDIGIYGGGSTQYLNFTPDSTGVVNFNNAAVTSTTMETWLSNSVIQINNAPAVPADFKITPIPAGGISISLAHPKPVQVSTPGSGTPAPNPPVK